MNNRQPDIETLARRFLKSVEAQRMIENIVKETSPRIIKSICNEKIPSKVKKESQKSVSKELKLQMTPFISSWCCNNMNQIISFHYSSTVSATLDKEIPEKIQRFLCNNQAMQNLIQSHIANLELQLSNTTRTIIQKVVSEPEYNTVIETYGVAAMERVNERYNKWEKDINFKTEKEVLRIKNNLDKELLTMKTHLQETRDRLNTANKYITCGFGLVIISLAVIVAYLPHPNKII